MSDKKYQPWQLARMNLHNCNLINEVLRGLGLPDVFETTTMTIFPKNSNIIVYKNIGLKITAEQLLRKDAFQALDYVERVFRFLGRHFDPSIVNFSVDSSEGMIRYFGPCTYSQPLNAHMEPLVVKRRNFAMRSPGQNPPEKTLG